MKFAQHVLAYAGLVDGEGSVCLTRRKANEHRSPSISVPNCAATLTSWMWVTFGGSLSGKRPSKSNHRLSTVWSLSGDKALEVLRLIRPYMREPEKCRRADLLLRDYKRVTSRNGKYAAEALRKKRSFERDFLRNARRRLVITS